MWYCQWIDLPHLNSIELGNNAFQSSLSTVISSIWIEWMNNRSSTFEFDQTWWMCTLGKKWWFILFIENGKWYWYEWIDF